MVLTQLKPLEDKALPYIQKLVSGEDKTYTSADIPSDLYNIILNATKIIFDSYEIPGDDTLPYRQQYALEAFLNLIGRKAVIFENPNILGQIPKDNTTNPIKPQIDPLTGNPFPNQSNTYLDPVSKIAYSDKLKDIIKIGNLVLAGGRKRGASGTF